MPDFSSNNQFVAPPEAGDVVKGVHIQDQGHDVNFKIIGADVCGGTGNQDDNVHFVNKILFTNTAAEIDDLGHNNTNDANDANDTK